LYNWLKLLSEGWDCDQGPAMYEVRACISVVATLTAMPSRSVERCRYGESVIFSPSSCALVYEVHEPLGLGRGEVDVIGDAIAGDADRERPAPELKAG
jgi:hypothetical protein